MSQATQTWTGTGAWPELWSPEMAFGGLPLLNQVAGQGRVTKASGDAYAGVITIENTMSLESDQAVTFSCSANVVRGGLASREKAGSYYACEVGASNADRLRILKVTTSPSGVRTVTVLGMTLSDVPGNCLVKGVAETLLFHTLQHSVEGITKLTATLRPGQPNAISLTVLDDEPALQGKGRTGLWVRGTPGTRVIAFSSYTGPAPQPTERRWSNPLSWPSGVVPMPDDDVVIEGSEPMIFDLDEVSVKTLQILAGATLTFDPQISSTLRSAGNIEVQGLLVMKPARHEVTHKVVFTGSDESIFVGGGMTVVPTDVGLWVMGAGRLDLLGSMKTSWCRATSILAGAMTIVLETEPVGWQVGDEIMICPSSDDVNLDKPNHGTENAWGQFETRTIVDMNGATVFIDKAMTWAHPAIDLGSKILGTEVANLTRNVRIEGLPPAVLYPRVGGMKNDPGRAHIFIHTTEPVMQSIRRVAIRYMGPRKAIDAKSSKDVLGRYGIHFHHCMETSKGSVVRDTVVRDCGSHAFVPHASHGVMICRCISFNTSESAFWWDSVGDEHHTRTDETMVLDCLAARVQADGADPNLNGYLLGSGKGNMILRSVAVGIQGTSTSAGFHWPSQANDAEFNVWQFEDNVAHNNRRCGARVWQNDSQPHQIVRFIVYRCFGPAVDQGAYRNPYVYVAPVLVQNGLGDGGTAWLQHNNSKAFGIGAMGQGQVIDAIVDVRNASAHALRITAHGLPPEGAPWLKIGWVVDGCKAEAIAVDEFKATADSQEVWGLYDLVDWTVEGRELMPSDFRLIQMNTKSRIRVQRRDRTAFQIEKQGAGFSIQPIAPFYPYGAP